MIRALRAIRDDEPPPTIPAFFELLGEAFDRSITPILDQYASDIRELRAENATLKARMRAMEERHEVTDLHAHRLKRDAVLPFDMDKAERRLRDGIEFDVVAESLDLSPAELHRQLMIRQEWMRRHATAVAVGGGVTRE